MKICKQSGITLIELLTAMIIIAILGAIIAPKVFISFDYSRQTAVSAILTGIRTDISTHATGKLISTGSRAMPTYLEMTTDNLVFDAPMPNNPYNGNNTIRNAIGEYNNNITGQPVNGDNGWAYDENTGEIWANSNVDDENSL